MCACFVTGREREGQPRVQLQRVVQSRVLHGQPVCLCVLPSPFTHLAPQIDAQTNAAGNDPSRVADIRASIARSLQEYSKLSDKLSDISLRDSAHASF